MYDLVFLKKDELPLETKMYPELLELSANLKREHTVVAIIEISTLVPVSRDEGEFLVPFRKRFEFLDYSADNRESCFELANMECEKIIDKWMAPTEEYTNNTGGLIRLYKYID